MIHPLYSILIATLILTIIIFLFWPKRGMIARWRYLLRQSSRSYMEDALKHIFQCEREKVDCTLESLAGALSLNREKAARIVNDLKNTQLIHIEKNRCFLTGQGREYALRVLRLHRIWESYLATETSVPESEWHQAADRREHFLTAAQVEQISEKLGNPLYDPHGDPIPGADGSIPPDRGIHLTDLENDQLARVIEIEDDPENVYQLIRANDIALGMTVELIDVKENTVKLKVDGHEKILPLIAAAQIRVETITREETSFTPLESLLILKNGQKAKVLNISKDIRGQNRRRLLDLGLVPGTTIEKEMESTNGNPIAYKIRGATIALRKDQARHIKIEKLEEAV